MEKYGADAMRFYMLSSPVVQAENLLFSEKGVADVANKNISRLYNVLSFYQLYQDDTPAKDTSKNLLDVWIISRLNEVGLICELGYEGYRLDIATRPLTDFIEDLSAWYLRRSRERFKEDGTDKKDALATLRFVLKKVSLLMAPAMPFFAEYIFKAVREENEEESVHLMTWPKFVVGKLDIVTKMSEVKNIVNLILGERMGSGIKVKQPLLSAKIKGGIFKIEKNTEENKKLLDLIKDEVNIKEIIFDNKMSDLIFLNTNITEELREEGIMREIVRAVQAERKNQNLVPQDKIFVELFLANLEKEIVEKNKEFFLKEFRAEEILLGETDDNIKKINIKKI
jgi:isoleucyl-tRNA synthetase